MARSSRRGAAATIGRPATLRSSLRPGRGPYFRPMRGLCGTFTVGSVVSALRSFWAEPPASDPPARVWWDWPLVLLLVVGGTLEAALREDVPARAVAFVVAVTPVLLLWRRARPLPVTVALFGVNVLGDAVTRIATGDPMELYASVYVLLLPTRCSAGAPAATRCSG